jgi:hypothetical protein
MIPSDDVPLSNIPEIKQPEITHTKDTKDTKDINELQEKIAFLISEFKKKHSDLSNVNLNTNIAQEANIELPATTNIGTSNNTTNIGTSNTTNNIGTVNTHNIGTINAPVTNYNINITPYDQPNNYIDEQTLKKILKCGFMSVQEFITKIHFNKDHPENHNVYISNKKEWLASYYNGTEWVLDKNNEILDTLYDNSSYYLITKYDELTDELDEPTQTKFGRYKSSCDDKKLTKNIKNAIKFILYNKKKIVTDTLKKMPIPPALAGIAE